MQTIFIREQPLNVVALSGHHIGNLRCTLNRPRVIVSSRQLITYTLSLVVVTRHNSNQQVISEIGKRTDLLSQQPAVDAHHLRNSEIEASNQIAALRFGSFDTVTKPREHNRTDFTTLAQSLVPSDRSLE